MSELVKLTGALEWCKVDPNNPEPPFGNEKGGKWSTGIYPNPASLELVRELQAQGIKNKVKRNEETKEWFVKFSRPCARYNKDGVVTKKFDPPKVTGAEPKDIGNGSLADVTLEVYEHDAPGGSKAKAARLLAIDVTRLTPRT